MKIQRLQEAKTNNAAFQMFDKMLGLEKNPKMLKLKEENPLNNITVPQGKITNLDSRIEQLYQDAGRINVLNSQSRKAASNCSSYRSDNLPGSAKSMKPQTADQEGSSEEETSLEEELYDFTIDDLLDDSRSPGMKTGEDYDIPLFRDKQNQLQQLETIISAIVNRCILNLNL